MFSDLGNGLLGARKIILQCLCMHGASWTAAQTDFLCAVHHLSSVEILSFQSHLGVPESSEPRIILIFLTSLSHKDFIFLLILHIH